MSICKPRWQATKLKEGLRTSQAADGIERELQTIRAGITRWNGIFLGLIRNIQLKEHITSALAATSTINVAVSNEDGEEEGTLVRQTADISPSSEEWGIGAQVSVVLEPAFRATQLLQGLKTTPDHSYRIVYNLWKVRLCAAIIFVFQITSLPCSLEHASFSSWPTRFTKLALGVFRSSARTPRRRPSKFLPLLLLGPLSSSTPTSLTPLSTHPSSAS
jgi:hypothetical protein